MRDGAATAAPALDAASITPDTRLGDLLARWPTLEDVLVDISPHFRALRNPVLRRTVARVATLRQVAQVSGVPLGTLIERLRGVTGATACGGDATAGAGGAEPRPPWAATQHATRRHDARAAIEAGEHPMAAVMQDLAALDEGGVYELVTPFVPAPLVDLARGKGFQAWSGADEDGAVRTWFRRGGA